MYPSFTSYFSLDSYERVAIILLDLLTRIKRHLLFTPVASVQQIRCTSKTLLTSLNFTSFFFTKLFKAARNKPCQFPMKSSANSRPLHARWGIMFFKKSAWCSCLVMWCIPAYWKIKSLDLLSRHLDKKNIIPNSLMRLSSGKKTT